jgi:hypothetical protein
MKLSCHETGAVWKVCPTDGKKLLLKKQKRAPGPSGPGALEKSGSLLGQGYRLIIGDAVAPPAQLVILPFKVQTGADVQNHPFHQTAVKGVGEDCGDDLIGSDLLRVRHIRAILV